MPDFAPNWVSECQARLFGCIVPIFQVFDCGFDSHKIGKSLNTCIRSDYRPMVRLQSVMNKQVPIFDVYVKPGCPWCVEVVNYLKKEGYDFNEIDVIADRAAFQKMIDLSGQSSAPTMTVGELMLADFGVEELVPFLQENDLMV